MESFEKLSDADLAQLLAGDRAEAAYAELYRRYAGRIFDFVARTVHDLAAAEDITQRAFIRAWEQRDSLRAPGAVRAWLFRIANNLRLNHVTATPLTLDSDDQEAVLEIGDASPEERALSRDAARLVRDAAASLEPQQQAVLALAIRQQLSSAEIAAVLLVEAAQASEMVHRSGEALGNAVRNLLVARRRMQCERLAELLPAGGAQLTPETRASVDDHMRRCELCHAIAARVTAPEELLGALVPLPLPDHLRPPPHLALRPTAAGVSARETSDVAAKKPLPPSLVGPPDERRRRQRALVLIALVVLVAGGGGALTYLLLHGRAAGNLAAIASNSGSGQSASSSRGASTTPLFGAPLPADLPPPSPTATSTPTTAPAGQPPPVSAAPTPPPVRVTAISVCFFDAHNACHAGVAVRGCTPSGSVAGDVCRFQVSFRVTPGVATALHWSLQGTVAYCVGRPGAQSAPFGPVSGSLSISGTSSPETVTTPPQSLSIDVNPSRGTVSTAIVTSAEGPGISGTTGFYGTGNC